MVVRRGRLPEADTPVERERMPRPVGLSVHAPDPEAGVVRASGASGSES